MRGRKKGYKHSKQTIDKISKSKAGKSAVWAKGSNSYAWKGDKVSYPSIHQWVAYWKGSPDTCEQCGKTGFKVGQIQWANIDHKYRRVLEDYIRLCVKCHFQFDGRASQKDIT